MSETTAADRPPTQIRVSRDMGVMDFLRSLPEAHPLAREMREGLDELLELRARREALEAALEEATAEWLMFRTVDGDLVSVRADKVVAVKAVPGGSLVKMGREQFLLRESVAKVMEAVGVTKILGQPGG